MYSDLGHLPMYTQSLFNFELTLVLKMRRNCRTWLILLLINYTCPVLDSQWIDVGDVKGDTPMHAAAIADGVEVLEFLLSCECNPDIANYAGYTPAHLAKTEATLKVLYDAGATMYCMDSESRIPLWIACQDGRHECVRFLCSTTPAQFLLWKDKSGDSPLHVAAMNGHHKAVDALCQWLVNEDDLYVLNSKHYTPAHVSSTATVLQRLYENGADLWVRDSKGRFPLFFASFHGRVDCVAFLLELALTTRSDSIEHLICAVDHSGDTALHAACLCGHLQCVILLLFFIRDVPNLKQLRPHQLAERAGYYNLAKLVLFIENQRNYMHNSYCSDDHHSIGNGYHGPSEGSVDMVKESEAIYQCSFEQLSAVLLYYGSRWIKLYDSNSNSLYYFDRATSFSQWERPEFYDEDPKQEQRNDLARSILIQFYTLYNSERLQTLDELLMTYKDNFTKLFLQLADRYNVQDLSMFREVMNFDSQ